MNWICSYREWGNLIYENVSKTISCKLIESQKEFNENLNLFADDDKIFFLGWSWIVPDDVVQNHECICLHPSPLPRYRGGSPIQHQIINGESSSAVTYFRMTDKLDAGNILFQEEFSLDGNLEDIMNRIVALGIKGIHDILNGNIKERKQNETEATYFKRRKPNQSEITVDDFSNFSAKELYDKIRSLQDPYPNAYVMCKDKKKLFLKVVDNEK